MFEKVIPALVTPFDATENIDYGSLEKLLTHLHNVPQILIAGTTGEGSSLTLAEIEDMIIYIRSRFPEFDLIVNTGRGSLQETLACTRRSVALGVEKALVMLPPYILPPFEGIKKYFTQVTEEIPHVIVYHHPRRTGKTLSAEELVELAAIDEISGIKDCSEDLRLMRHVASRTLLFCGNDELYVPALRAGAGGIITPLGNADYSLFVQIADALEAGDVELLESLQKELGRKIDATHQWVNPIGIKILLSDMGLIEPNMRLPLCLPQVRCS